MLENWKYMYLEWGCWVLSFSTLTLHINLWYFFMLFCLLLASTSSLLVSISWVWCFWLTYTINWTNIAQNFCLVSNMYTKINNFHIFFQQMKNKNTFNRPNRKISSEFCFARKKLGFRKFISWMVECIMNTWEKENYEKKFHLDHIKMLKTRQVWLKRIYLTHSNTLHNPFCCFPVTFYYDYRRFLWKIWRNVLHPESSAASKHTKVLVW